MSIDLSQFHAIFFEESFDGLDVMEQELLGLSPGDADLETINTIFRAAHSIKGGSATFKFDQVAEFTHVLETLLDEMRNGQRPVTNEAVELLLKSVDCLREMLGLLQQEAAVEESLYSDLVAQLNQLIGGSNDSDVGADASELTDEGEIGDADVDNQDGNQDQTLIWHISFKPETQILRTGNEPIRMFRELAEMGELEVLAHTDQLPSFDELVVEDCFLWWELFLHADVEDHLIKEVFEWVEDECELNIEQIDQAKYQQLNSNWVGGNQTADQTIVKTPIDKNLEQSSAAGTNADENEAVAQSSIVASNSALEISKTNADSSKSTTNNAEQTVEDSQSTQLQTTRKSSSQPTPKKSANAGMSIRVGIDKVDSLINMVGELVITQSMLGQMGDDFDMSKLERLREGLNQLEQNTRELQESVMRIRMLPISFVFNRFPRLVRDLSNKLDKQVDLVILGEQTELDKTVMEQIGDPMVHLVRNSMDHGIETVDQRLAVGKPASGTVTLNAFHQGGNIVIEIIDDGAGINKDKVLQKAIDKGLVPENNQLTDDQINMLIFEPGFSTAEQVSDVSGRGVGMDVVRRNIQSLGGTVEVTSEQGVGSTFSIRLPLTLAILDGQLVRVGNQIYVVPLIAIVESLQIRKSELVSVTGNIEIYRLRNDHVPIVRLYEEFQLEHDSELNDQFTVVVVEAEGTKIGFLVDELLAQQQVVIKSLETNFVSINGISGATILGDGQVALILDVAGMIKRCSRVAKNYGRASAA